jgi:hypothetical protein
MFQRGEIRTSTTEEAGVVKLVDNVQSPTGLLLLAVALGTMALLTLLPPGFASLEFFCSDGLLEVEDR